MSNDSNYTPIISVQKLSAERYKHTYICVQVKTLQWGGVEASLRILTRSSPGPGQAKPNNKNGLEFCSDSWCLVHFCVFEPSDRRCFKPQGRFVGASDSE